MADTERGREREPELRLREFVESDDAEVTSWFADAGELRFFAGRRLRWPLDAGQWRSIRLDPSVTAWTAVIGEDPTPMGHAEMVRESLTVVRLARIAVAPAFRGRGLGRALVTQVIARCRDAGFLLATLASHPDNTNAIRAYRSLGFLPSETPSSAQTGGAGTGDQLLLELKLDGGADARVRSGSSSRTAGAS
jgi:GNAT superfamily N-acetyltransferase